MSGQYKCSAHLLTTVSASGTPPLCISPRVEALRPLFGRTLVLVAHPDDEAVGCGGLQQRMNDPIVVFATDGAPRSDFFWNRYGSREEYAQVRRNEAMHALAAIGFEHLHFLSDEQAIADQELHLHLSEAFAGLDALIELEMPDAILSLAYEGGHPDHDSCSFLAVQLGRKRSIPVWEMPLYHRQSAQTQVQQFLDLDAGIAAVITDEELTYKREMFSCYRSQADVLRQFHLDRESFRPVKAYDFSQPPHPGRLNYEAWGWPVTGAELCASFSRFQSQSRLDARKRGWGTAA